MKKTMLIIVGLAFLATISLSSCKKCTTCSYNGYSAGEVCKKGGDLDSYKRIMENAGYSCD